MNRKTLLLPAAAALLMAGCGSSSSSSSSSAASSSSAQPAATPAATAVQSGMVKVEIKNLSFIPAAVHVKVGSTVVWNNVDNPPHNVKPDSAGSFTASPPVINPGQSYSYKFTKPGTFTYFCTIHPFMKASVVVSQ